jgi:hypothetical protein
MLTMTALSLSVSNSGSQTNDKPPTKTGQRGVKPTSNQLLMRDKLKYANQVLDGLALEDFSKIAASAEMMRMISKAASWHVLDSDEYNHLSKDFQEQAADLERHAKQKNLDAAALDYMRMSLTCVQCHKYMRDIRKNSRR